MPSSFTIALRRNVRGSLATVTPCAARRRARHEQPPRRALVARRRPRLHALQGAELDTNDLRGGARGSPTTATARDVDGKLDTRALRGNVRGSPTRPRKTPMPSSFTIALRRNVRGSLATVTPCAAGRRARHEQPPRRRSWLADDRDRARRRRQARHDSPPRKRSRLADASTQDTEGELATRSISAGSFAARRRPQLRAPQGAELDTNNLRGGARASPNTASARDVDSELDTIALRGNARGSPTTACTSWRRLHVSRSPPKPKPDRSRRSAPHRWFAFWIFLL
jgi:hypothetical protein